MLCFRCRIGLLCAALIGVIGWRISLSHHESEAFAAPSEASVSDVAVGTVAPSFSIADRGQQVTLEGLHGRTAVLCFGSPSREQSKQYRPRVKQLRQQYAGRVKFLNVDTESIDGQQIASAFAAKQSPYFVVIDAQGVIAYRGDFDDNANEEIIEQHFCADVLREIAGEPQMLKQRIAAAK